MTGTTFRPPEMRSKCYCWVVTSLPAPVVGTCSNGSADRNRVIPLGEGHFRRTHAEFVAHYHRKRNHQGLDNELIDGNPDARHSGVVRRCQRIGGLLSFYYRAA